MGINQMKIILTAAGFVLIFLTGYLLYRTGQPFNAGVLTLHKLISVAAIVYLVVTVLGINKMAPLDKSGLIVCIGAGLFFLGAVATGGILSAAKELPAVVQTMHKVLSLLTLLSTAATFFLLFRRR
jgi:heme A synthase